MTQEPDFFKICSFWRKLENHYHLDIQGPFGSFLDPFLTQQDLFSETRLHRSFHFMNNFMQKNLKKLMGDFQDFAL